MDHRLHGSASGLYLGNREAAALSGLRRRHEDGQTNIGLTPTRQSQCGHVWAHAPQRARAKSAAANRLGGPAWTQGISHSVPSPETQAPRKNAGCTEAQAEPATRVMRPVHEIDVSNFVTKAELAQAMANLEHKFQIAFTKLKRKIIRWLITTLAIQSFVVVGFMIMMIRVYGH
jgi:hypothetical protein